MILPFEYQAQISKDAELVSFGQRLVEINEHAVEARRGQVGEARVKAEMKGVVRAEELLNQASPGDLLFLFSPPGSEEEGFGADGQRRLSFTYIFEVEEGQEENKVNIRVIAIPRAEIPALVQIQQFVEIFGGEAATTLLSEEEQPLDRRLVSSPVLISGLSHESKEEKLDKYLRVYTQKSWQELEEELERGLKLKNDEKAEPRRMALIQSVSWQIRRYVDERDSARLNNIGEAARVVLAREASGHFAGLTPEELLNEYERTEKAMWMQIQYQQASSEMKAKLEEEHGALLVASESHLRGIREAIMEDPNAKEILSGSACGGGGLGDALEGIGGKFSGLVMGRGHLLEKQLESLKETSTTSSESMKCVKCPFCSELVDAIVTSEKIECPKCHKSASRG
jgi:hypothetical protein